MHHLCFVGKEKGPGGCHGPFDCLIKSRFRMGVSGRIDKMSLAVLDFCKVLTLRGCRGTETLWTTLGQ